MKPRPLLPGKTFLDALIPQMEGYLHLNRERGREGDRPFWPHMQITYQTWLAAINHADTRRFLFDAEQAERFAPLVEFPEEWKEHVRPPFPSMYMEFSEPVQLGDAWAVNDTDYLRALILTPAKPFRVYVGRNILAPGAPPQFELRPGSHLVLFFYDPETDTYTDRNVAVDIRSGKVYSTRYMAERTFEWRNAPSPESLGMQIARDGVYGKAKEVLDNLIKAGGTEALSPGDLEDLKSELIPTDAHDKSTGLEAVPDNREICFEAGAFPKNRNVGWWERQAMAATAFVQWCLSYMMAKGITVELREISRQQKRWLTRHGKPWPKPWHVVVVDPRYVRNLDEANRNPGSKHSYRYDVMGHLRWGRHRIGTKREDGTYDHRQVLEWVPDHQRGLANEIYIPATRVIKAGRKIPLELRGGKAGE